MTDKEQQDPIEGEFTETATDLAVRPGGGSDLVVMPVMGIAQALQRRIKITELVQQAMVEGVDYGIIPGTRGKPTLLKPGAEKLNSYFGLTPIFEVKREIERWDKAEPLFFYRYVCRLMRGDVLIAEGIGSCNSWEDRYRYRWVSEDRIPDGIDPSTLETRGGKISEFTFAVDEGRIEGEYAKPQSYWDRFRAAIENGTAVKIQKQARSGKVFDAWQIDATYYRIENREAFSQVNTIDKIAQKRALIAATLIAVNASEFFTQDIEDLPPEDLSGTLDESTSAPPWAGEDEGHNQVADAPERPYSPVLLRDRLQRAAFEYAQAISQGKEWTKPLVEGIDKQRGAVNGNIEKAFAGDKRSAEKRHSFFAFIWGDDITSSKALTPAQVLAHRKHLDWHQDSGGDWMPDSMALREIRQVVEQRMKDRGQAELPIDQVEEEDAKPANKLYTREDAERDTKKSGQDEDDELPWPVRKDNGEIDTDAVPF